MLLLALTTDLAESARAVFRDLWPGETTATSRSTLRDSLQSMGISAGPTQLGRLAAFLDSPEEAPWRTLNPDELKRWLARVRQLTFEPEMTIV